MTVYGPVGDSAAHPAAVPAGGGPQINTPDIDQLPDSFRGALHRLRRAAPRREAVVEEVPAPSRLAPYAVALGAEVQDPSTGSPTHPVSRLRPGAATEDILATGRMILLHDPAGQEAWEGTFRMVIYIRAELEPEMGNDPLLGSVAWTWLCDSLSQHGAEYTRAGGTATRILSESFGSLQTRQASNEVELRASWTPADAAFGAHLEAWADMVCSFAGLPPVPDGVVALPHIRRG